MESKIKHFLVDLEEIDRPFSYVSEGHEKVKQIRQLLEDLLELIK